MLEVVLLPLSPTVEPAVLAPLNNAHAAELSWLDRNRLALLLRQAFHARRIGEVDGFLLVFDQSAAYDSPNYLWFRQPIDGSSMSIASSLRLLHGGGATPACCMRICSTVQGFAEVGQATIHQGSRTVRYLARAIDR
jgi:predicted GNAT superfamily acetyltransferase